MAITEFDYFCADAIGISAKFYASVDDEQAEGFLKRIALEYEADGSPKNRKKWLQEKLKGKFMSMDKPPKWVGEPRWKYFEDEPMVFLQQFKVENTNGNIRERISIGDTIFVFATRSPVYPEKGKPWNQVYRLVVQTEEGMDIHLE